MLGALLNECMNHRKFDLEETVGKKLIELEPHHYGRYVGLSNVYAVVKRWDTRSLREAMKKRGVKKFPRFSVVELFGVFHIAHNKSHPNSEETYSLIAKFYCVSNET